MSPGTKFWVIATVAPQIVAWSGSVTAESVMTATGVPAAEGEPAVSVYVAPAAVTTVTGA